MYASAVKFSLLTAIFFLSCWSDCRSQNKNAVLRIGQRLKIQSQILKETRQVFVYLPPSYSNQYFQPQQYPVLYVLDGGLHFQSLSGLIQILGSGVNQTYAIPEMIIVAIPNTNRVRDLTPTHSTTGYDGKNNDFFKPSGGADNFLKFITTELAPKIESSFRTLPYRILVGHSFGGLTAMHALGTSPTLFNAYVAIDPSLWWDSSYFLKQKSNYFTNTNLKGRNLYLAQANSQASWETANPHFEGIKEMAVFLETENTSGLRYRYKFYPDDDHSSVAFISEYDALRFFFEKYRADYNKVSTAQQLKAQYQQLSDDLGFAFLPPERIAQDFGTTYLSLSQSDVAYDFFQMNLDHYPNSAAAYANMGQYWKSKGDKKKALEYYEKSVKIFPKNKDSRNNIEALKKEIKNN
jgi:predicted alpha/beta superfamily hydrolase